MAKARMNAYKDQSQYCSSWSFDVIIFYQKAIQLFFWFIFQHSCVVWHQDTCSGSSETTQRSVRDLQMDRVWWGISTETCWFCSSGWSWSNCNGFIALKNIYCLNLAFTLFLIQPLDLEKTSLSVHIFTLNEDGPSMLTLEEDEELTAASHWLLPAGNIVEESTLPLQAQWKLIKIVSRSDLTLYLYKLDLLFCFF